MKKILLLVFSFLILPSVTIAEETVNNGDVVTPIGTISVYAGLESDTQLLERGYLIANGASLSRTDYPELFAIIKDTYGASDEEHFNLPDLRGRTVVGMKSDDTDFNTLGKKGGEKTVTLTVEQIPSHTHTFTGTASTTSVESNSHTHTFSGTTSSNGAHSHVSTSIPSIASNYVDTTTSPFSLKYTLAEGNVNIEKNETTVSGAHTHTFTGTTSTSSTTHTHTFTATGTNASAGGGKAHNNMQPYIALKYIIKVK